MFLSRRVQNYIGLLFLVASVLMLLAIVSLVRDSRPASAHESAWDLEASCGSYVLRLDITDTFDGEDHRIIVTRDDYAVKSQDITGGGDLLAFVLDGGSTPEEVLWKAYIFDKEEGGQEGGYVYAPENGDFFRPNIVAGQLGLVERVDQLVRLENTCPTATPEPTSTPVPTSTSTPAATPTATSTPEPLDLCTNIEGVQSSVPEGLVWSAFECVAPAAAPTPAPPASGTGSITPPSTGSGGLR